MVNLGNETFCVGLSLKTKKAKRHRLAREVTGKLGELLTEP